MSATKLFNKTNLSIFFLILLTPLIFNPFGIKPFEIPKQTFLIALIGIFAIYQIFLNYSREWKIPFNKYLFFFSALAISTILLSNVFSISPIESFLGTFERNQGTLIELHYFLIFAIFLFIFRQKVKIPTFLHLILILSIPLSIIAILQYFNFDPIIATNLDSFNQRPPSTLGHPNMLGQILIIPILISHIFLIKKVSKNRTILYAGTLFLNYGALLLTQNKASMLGLFIGLILIFIINFKNLIKWQKWAYAFALLIISFAGLFIFFNNPRSFFSRSYIIPQAIEIISQTPIFGHGAETYQITAQSNLNPSSYLTENLFTIPDRIHNQTLQIVHDFGVLGIILAIIVFFFTTKSLFTNKKSINQIATICIIAVTISLQFSFYMVSQAIFTMAFLAIICHQNLKISELKITSKTFKVFFSSATILFVLFAIHTQFAIEYKNIKLAEAIESYLFNQEKSNQIFSELLQKSPPSRHLYESIILFTANTNSQLAEQALNKFEENIGDNFYFYIQKAKVTKNTKYLENAKAQAPNYASIYLTEGDIAFEQKEYEIAIEGYQNLLNLAPDYWKKSYSKDFKTSEQSRIYRKNHPQLAEAINNLIESYIATNQYGKAQALIEEL